MRAVRAMLPVNRWEWVLLVVSVTLFVAWKIGVLLVRRYRVSRAR